MIRILKKYSHYYRTSSHSTMVVPGSSMAFSGYPGTISSVDDFYIMSSKIVAMETTIGNSNKTLWKNVTPTGQVNTNSILHLVLIYYLTVYSLIKILAVC